MVATMDCNEQKLVKKKTKYANESNYVALAETCMLLGAFYQDREEHLRALNEYKLAANAYEKLNKPMDRGLAFRMVGEMYAALGQFKESLQNVQAYMRAAQREANTKALQEAHTTLGRVYLQRAESYQRQGKTTNAEADLAKAEKSFRTALSICDELKRTLPKIELFNMQARAHLNLGITFDSQNRRVPAKENMERAIRLAKEADLFDLLYTCYNAMALSCSRWEGTDESGDSGQTLRLLNLSLEVASRLTNRASKMCQTLMLMATFFLKMDDFQSARQTLKRAYRLKTPVAVDAKRIKQKLKVLVAMCRMEDELITTEAINYARRKELYERMGDGACKLRNFSKAIDYYKLMLQNAESLGEADRKLIPCYVSLYQTYIDNRQYEQALEYLWKEHNIICNEPKEAYYTLMKIARLYEHQNIYFFDIQHIYLQAKEQAKKLQSIDLQRAAVQRCVKMLRAQQMDMMADKIEQDALGEGITLPDTALEPDSEELTGANQSLDLADFEAEVEVEDEGEEADTPNVGDEIDLEVDLSDDSDGDPALTIGEDLNNSSTAATSRTRKRGKRFTVRRNKKGETQLHQAAISGNKALAEQLLQLGHPVNERDYAGWLPLHEACIHGYPEIVSLLLNRGAHINDKGGTSCEGITPLHDACRNGHLDVITVLLDHGANATQRNDFGETALSMLDGWYKQLKVPLTATEKEQHTRIRQQLVAQLDAAAIPTSQPKTSSQKSATKNSTEKNVLSSHASNANRERSPSLSPDIPSSASVPARHRNAIYDDDNDQTEGSEDSPNEGDAIAIRSVYDSATKRKPSSGGVTEYQNVMKAMRKNLLSDEVSPKPSTSQKRRQTYVEEDDVDEAIDNWLIDDMKPAAKKSRVTGDFLGTPYKSSLGGSKSSSSLTHTPTSSQPVESSRVEPTTYADHSLIDSDDDDAFINMLDRNNTVESAFDVLMSNSARSFQSTKSRRNSSESRSSSFNARRRSSTYQSSLLEVGFERHFSPSPVGEQENDTPEPEYQSPVKATPEFSTSPVVVPEPVVVHQYIIRVILDTSETYTVHYDEKLISSTQTVAWLRDAVAKQYIMKHGKRPTIKLKPTTGFDQSSIDAVTLQELIEHNSPDGTILQAEVSGLEDVDLVQFYDEYTREHNLETHERFKNWLVVNRQIPSIALAPDFAYGPVIQRQNMLNMMFLMSFFQQDWLVQLELSINSITDDHIATLVRYLPACRQLRTLRLQLNLLTHKAVEMLCFGCTDPVDPLVDTGEAAANSNALGGGCLTELDLSHNPLFDVALVPLDRLCRNLPHLSVLKIRSTDITHLPASINIKRMQTLDISENPLTEEGVQHVLQQLREGALCEAHFKSLTVHCSNFKSLLLQTLSHHRIDGLQKLNLVNCRLSDDDLESLLPAIGRNCPSLTHLDLSLNAELTKRSFFNLLGCCAGAVFDLHVVKFEHDVLLWKDMETYASTEELLQLIEYSPSVRYPRRIEAFLPAYRYSAERYEKLLAVINRLWDALWPSRQRFVKRLGNSLQVTLSLDPI